MTDISKLVKTLRNAGVSEAKPITPDQARRFRGIGLKKLSLLEDIGLVRLDDFADLPTRVGNIVKLAGYRSRAEVITAIETGCFILDGDTVYFRRRPAERFHHLRNCGAQTFHQICAWAGVHSEP